MTRSLFFLFATLLLAFSSTGSPITDWSQATPGGNEIQNYDQVTLVLQNGEEVKPLAKWFFYKDHVCGLLENGTYFMANELTSQVDTFGTEKDWENYGRENKLHPFLWTRWYTSDWVVLDSDVLLFFVYNYYIAFALLFLIFGLLYFALKKEKLKPTKPATLVLLGLILLLIVWWCLERFPQSF